MTLATATSALESRFEPFLYAAVREDPDGTPLTVLSVLARLDIDPWEEAARLAQLPGAAAVQALAGWISTSRKGSAASEDSGAIALRLITLLPSRSDRRIASKKALSQGTKTLRAGDHSAMISQALLGLIFLAVLLVSHWMVVNQLASQSGKPPSTAPARVLAAPAARSGVAR